MSMGLSSCEKGYYELRDMQFFNDISHYWKPLGGRMLVCLGALLSVQEVLDNIASLDCLKPRLPIGIIILSVVYALYPIVNKKDSMSFQINKRTRITVKYGDLFSERGIQVIPVNEFFDTHLGDGIIAEDTLHGIFLKKHDQQTKALERQIRAELQKMPSIGGERKRTKVAGLPTKRYPLGTCIRITVNGQTYILVAVTRFNSNEHVEVNEAEYPAIAQQLFYYIEQLNDARKVCMPLIGGGQAGFQLSPMQMLNMLLQAALLSKRLSVVKGIDIVLYGEDIREEINLNILKYLFNRWKDV